MQHERPALLVPSGVSTWRHCDLHELDAPSHLRVLGKEFVDGDELVWDALCGLRDEGRRRRSAEERRRVNGDAVWGSDAAVAHSAALLAKRHAASLVGCRALWMQGSPVKGRTSGEQAEVGQPLATEQSVETRVEE
eukprot:scaffold202780_cov32-Tisochrysis_lutea.AAC.2